MEIYEIIEDEDNIYIIMELCDGTVTINEL